MLAARSEFGEGRGCRRPSTGRTRSISVAGRESRDATCCHARRGRCRPGARGRSRGASSRTVRCCSAIAPPPPVISAFGPVIGPYSPLRTASRRWQICRRAAGRTSPSASVRPTELLRGGLAMCLRYALISTYVECRSEPTKWMPPVRSGRSSADQPHRPRCARRPPCVPEPRSCARSGRPSGRRACRRPPLVSMYPSA